MNPEDHCLFDDDKWSLSTSRNADRVDLSYTMERHSSRWSLGTALSHLANMGWDSDVEVIYDWSDGGNFEMFATDLAPLQQFEH